MWRKERDDQHFTGVAVQKEEKDRVGKVKRLSKKEVITSPDLIILIPNPKTFSKVTDVKGKLDPKRTKKGLTKTRMTREISF